MTVPLLHMSKYAFDLLLSLLLYKADLEATLREVYAIPADTPCRVWHWYMPHTYELLSDPSQTIRDVGLYNMTVSKYFREHRVVIILYSYTRPLLLKNRT